MARLRSLPPRLIAGDHRRVKEPAKTAAPFYGTKDWKKARALCLALHGNRCAVCGRKDTRLFVDHIVELKDGGAPLDQANLAPKCGACHTAKTLRTRAARHAAPG